MEEYSGSKAVNISCVMGAGNAAAEAAVGGIDAAAALYAMK